MSQPSPTIYLIDDNADFRASAAFWLDAAGYQVQSLGDPEQALQALGRHPSARPGCVLMDVRMPEVSGLDLHDRMHERGLDLPVVYMSGHADVALAVRAMQKGAVSFLEKPLDEEALERALQAAFARMEARQQQQQHQQQQAKQAMPEDEAGPGERAEAGDNPGAQEFRRREATLAPREREVLGWVIQGIYNKNIADRMQLSVKTIELYRARGMGKMGARSVAELTRMMVSRQVEGAC